MDITKLIYRVANEEDRGQIEKLCSEHGINYPDGIFMLVAEDENGICGIIGLKTETFIEPFISGNPLVANNLYRMVEGFGLITGVKKFRCVTDEENEELFSKVGFETIETEKIIMERKF